MKKFLNTCSNLQISYLNRCGQFVCANFLILLFLIFCFDTLPRKATNNIWVDGSDYTTEE